MSKLPYTRIIPFLLLKFSDAFYMHFHLVMKLNNEQLKMDVKVDIQENKITKELLISAFGVTPGPYCCRQ